MASVQGHCDPRFNGLRDLFADHLKTGAELGASICVSVHGETVLDLWGGYTTPARTELWTRDTIVPVWSISKTISALAILLLIDRGQLHPDDPVAKHWPAFDTDDKRSILVRHLLSHTSALPSWDPELPVSDLLTNAPLATEKLIAQKPWWEPGTASGYHLISQGLLLGGLIHRVSGKPIQQFVADELVTPLSADFHLGLQDEKQWDRIAELVPPPPLPAKLLKNAPSKDNPIHIALRAMRGCRIEAQHSSTPAFRRSGIGSMGGLSNARGFNKILEIITHGGTVGGKQFLKPSTVDLIFQTQADGADLVLLIPIKMGMGFGLSSDSLDWMPTGKKVCFWGGYGGSIAIMDLDRGITFTYAMNRMEMGTLGNSNAEAYVRAFYQALNEKASL